MNMICGISTLPIVIILFRGCVPKMFVTSYFVTHCIYILFSLLPCSLWGVQVVGYVLACWSCPFVCTLHHKHIFPIIHYTIYGAMCFQFTHFHLWWLREYILCLIIIIKSEVWYIIHCLRLGHETMVCAVCFSIFLWVVEQYQIVIQKTVSVCSSISKGS